MKKQMMMSALSLTAALAAPVTFPQYALARSSKSEKAFSKTFSLIGDAAIRYKTNDGNYVYGKIYMDLDQSPLQPDAQNRILAEMTGHLYFLSDEAVEKDYEGKLSHMWMALAGDEGDIIIDLIHARPESRTYQVYGCTTTLGYCGADKFTVTFKNHYVEMNFVLPENFEYAYETTAYDGDKLVTKIEWIKEGYTALKKTVAVPE